MKENFLIEARAKHYAIGAFNVNSHDEMIALANKAQEMNIPIIMMASMSCARFMGAKHFADFVRILKTDYSVPVYSHLDHCTDSELLLKCVDAGFDYVMFDGSPLSFDENVRISRDLARVCHENGVFIEGELGVIAGEEGPVKSEYSLFTNPDDALRFVELTGIDSLAVSIGNAHGFYKGVPHLEFGLLQQISEKCSLPLVLHGGTGIPDEDIRRAITMGIAKVNVGTEIRKAYANALCNYVQTAEKPDVRPFLQALRAGVAGAAERYLNNFLH